MVYQTPIRRYERDALAKAAEQAVHRVMARHPVKDWEQHGFAFRVDDASYSVCDDPDSDTYSSYAQIEIEAFLVTKVTENGFRIRTGGWDDNPVTRWVDKRWTKQFACRDPKDAVRSFIARRTRQANIYEGRAAKARAMAAEAERLIKEPACPTL